MNISLQELAIQRLKAMGYDSVICRERSIQLPVDNVTDYTNGVFVKEFDATGKFIVVDSDQLFRMNPVMIGYPNQGVRIISDFGFEAYILSENGIVRYLQKGVIHTGFVRFEYRNYDPVSPTFINFSVLEFSSYCCKPKPNCP